MTEYKLALVGGKYNITINVITCTNVLCKHHHRTRRRYFSYLTENTLAGNWFVLTLNCANSIIAVSFPFILCLCISIYLRMYTYFVCLLEIKF